MTNPKNFQPISATTHGERAWRRPSSYKFAAADAVLPLVGIELSRAALSLPIAFIRHGESFTPAAVMGIEDGTNLLVGSDGRWLGTYIPAALRSYPFALVPTTDGHQVLCVDEAGDLVVPAGVSGAEPFFGEDGQLSPATRSALEFLQNVGAYQPATQAAADALAKHALIQPWPLTMRAGNHTHQVEGLFRVDEKALNELPSEAFLELRAAGALLLAYTQLLSMQQMELIQILLQAKAKSTPPARAGELDLSFMEGDTLRFS